MLLAITNFRELSENYVSRRSSENPPSPKMAASPSVRRLQIGNGYRSVGTFTSEVMCIPSSASLALSGRCYATP